MDSAAWSAGDDPVVGVVERDGEDDRASTGSGTASAAADSDEDGIDAPLEDALDARGIATAPVSVERGALEEVLAAEPSVLVARGESALSALARAESDVPVLPVGDVPGINTVAAERVPDALAAVLAGEAHEQPRPVLEVEVGTADGNGDGNGDRDHDSDGDRRTAERALFDVTLVTDEPARISEYAVRRRGETVASFRADGVVVATPAGSHGYTSAIDGPQLSAAVDGLVVSPIAPFVTRTRHWVLPDDDVALTVERDEGDVRVVADDRSVDTVAFGAEVTVSVADALPTLVVPDAALEASRS